MVSFTGWNGAARLSACSLGVLAGRKELLSVLTALDRSGSSTMHRAPAISQAAMMMYRNRTANRASAAMTSPMRSPP